VFSRGQFHQNILAAFFSTTRREAFFGEWRLSKGEFIWQISLYTLDKFDWHRMLVKFNGNFFDKHCVPATFHLCTTVGEIDPIDMQTSPWE